MPKARLEQRPQHAARRPTGSDHEHTAPRKRLSQIAGDVTHQTLPVRVVAEKTLAVLPLQRIHGTGNFCPAAAPLGELAGLDLERYRDVQPATTRGAEVADRLREAPRVDLDGAVLDRQAALLGEHRVDARRLAVRNGITHHGIERRAGGKVEQIAHGRGTISHVRVQSTIADRDSLPSRAAPANVAVRRRRAPARVYRGLL